MRKALVGTGLATAMAAVAGSVASQQGVRGGTPRSANRDTSRPTRCSPIAWTTLYVDIAATSAATIERSAPRGRMARPCAYIAALGANLALNAGWSWCFQDEQTRPVSRGGRGAGGQQR